ncbi:hypothetical protein B0A50_01959 [Salinomyces thailandicus]|uniref:tRNA-splicing endonuclease subunit Sen15 domain-containing protein n=1 Tax=Salinomyces thailandicus TaxID=706561 RepID=A0A4U0U6Z5_9PEZI|nr:hypothetical protein B0A50_01959 [Salinomyces thailandica]
MSASPSPQPPPPQPTLVPATESSPAHSPANTHPDFSLSSLQQFIADSQDPQKSKLDPKPTYPPELHHLALQVAHNIRFQQEWTDIRVHYRPSARTTAAALPRPILSGLPPRRLYVHPDEQIDVLRQQREQGKAGWPDLAAEREWVLPTHLRETWALRRFAEVFDALATVPAEDEGSGLFPAPNGARRPQQSQQSQQQGDDVSKWRRSQPKRLLLSTVDDDSTVVYYIVHDGIVKPRQN